MALRLHDYMMLSSEQTNRLAEMFRLLGDPTRLRIAFVCLDHPAAVAEIAEALAFSPALVSQHLRQLEEARVVAVERAGKDVLYTAANEHVRAVLKSMLAHVAEGAAASETGAAPEARADAARR